MTVETATSESHVFDAVGPVPNHIEEVVQEETVRGVDFAEHDLCRGQPGRRRHVLREISCSDAIRRRRHSEGRS